MIKISIQLHYQAISFLNIDALAVFLGDIHRIIIIHCGKPPKHLFFLENVEKILFFRGGIGQNLLKPPLTKEVPEFLEMFLRKWVCKIFFTAFDQNLSGGGLKVSISKSFNRFSFLEGVPKILLKECLFKNRLYLGENNAREKVLYIFDSSHNEIFKNVPTSTKWRRLKGYTQNCPLIT